MKKAALVITTYNNPLFLGLCLESLTTQTTQSFDVWIADDGSSDETRIKIELFRPFFGPRLMHVWQEDQGYQKSRINNQVFRQMESRQSDYPVMIGIDHDVILHRRFVEDHLAQHLEHDRLLFMGRRVDLGPWITERLSQTSREFDSRTHVRRFNRGLSLGLLISGFLGDSKNIFRAVRVSHPFLRRIFARDQVHDLLGSNFSVSTRLLFEVNGYNEEFQSYWGEDGDLFVRLRNVGAEIRGSKSLAIQYHLHHRRLDPSVEHQKRYQGLLNDSNYVFCKRGIRQ